jgi:hypothetical protein
MCGRKFLAYNVVIVQAVLHINNLTQASPLGLAVLCWTLSPFLTTFLSVVS